MTTDWKALCAELLAWAEKTSSNYYKQADVLLRARAALAEQPVEPTDEELREMFNENDWNYISPETFEDIARTVLACWGNHPAKPNSSFQETHQ